MRREQKRIILHVFLPLLIGSLIYGFFRSNIWFVQKIGITDPIINIASLSSFQKILIDSGPDFCWAYSFTSALFIWAIWQKAVIGLFPLLILVVVLFSEIIQLFLSPAFTFDWLDLIAAILGFGLSYLLIIRNEKN